MSSHAEVGSPASPGSPRDILEASWNPSEIQYRRRLSIRHSLKIVARNGIYAAIARLVVGLLKLIAKRGISKAFLKDISGEVVSLDPLKWAVVVSGYSSFRLCMQVAGKIGEHVYFPEKLAALLSGCICALPALVMNKSTRTELCLYALVRAAHAFCLRFIVPRLPPIARDFQHYDVLLMCASSSQIVYGCFYAQSTVPPSYLNFLIRASLYENRLVRGHSGCVRGHITPELIDHCRDKGVELLWDGSQAAKDQLCDFAHHGYTCNTWIPVYIAKNLLKIGIPLYAPLKVLAVVLLQRKRLMKHPAHVIVKSIRSVLTSSLFLALYIACISRSNCFTTQHGFRGGLPTALMCSSCGLSTFLEPKERRMDLALYCFGHALRSFILCQNRMGRLPYPRHKFVFLTYIASVAFLMYEYEEEPTLLHSRVRTALRFFLGDKAPEKPAPKHRHFLADAQVPVPTEMS